MVDFAEGLSVISMLREMLRQSDRLGAMQPKMGLQVVNLNRIRSQTGHVLQAQEQIGPLYVFRILKTK